MNYQSDLSVAPLAGAWIEILPEEIEETALLVAPLAGAWIEIGRLRTGFSASWSLPSRERGLK